MTNSLYKRIGGEAAVNAAVDIFYKKVIADTDLPAQINKQKQFLTYAFGGPNKYSGNGLRNAHRGAVAQGMNDAHFDRVMQLLGATLVELNVPQDLIGEAAAIAASTRKDVLNQ